MESGRLGSPRGEGGETVHSTGCPAITFAWVIPDISIGNPSPIFYAESIVLTLQLDDGYRKFLLGVVRKNVGRLTPRTCVPNSRVNVMFCVAGFRPGRRGPFVSAKGPKTIDAPSGLIGVDGRQPQEGGPTRSAQTRPAS